MAEFEMPFKKGNAEKEAAAIVYDYFQMILATKEGEIALKLGIRSIRTEEELRVLQDQYDRLKRTNNAIIRIRLKSQS